MTAADANASALRHLVRILVFIDDTRMMGHVIDLLRDQGFAEITAVHDPDELGLQLRLSQVDLVVAVSRTQSVFIGHFIHDLRHGLLECHPFPIVLMLLPSAEASHVRAVIDAGVDDLLVTPLKGDILAKRLGTFMVERRPFTVTHNYIGPNRRLANRPGTEPAILVQVPNPMRARAFGQDEMTLQQVLHEASLSLNRLKIERDGRQIAWLLDHLTAALGQSERDLAAINELVSQISNAAAEIARRAGDRSVQAVRAQARAVIAATRAIVFTREAVAEARTQGLISSLRKLTDMVGDNF